MARKLSFRSLLLWVLALWEDLSEKEIGARAGLDGKQVSKHLRRKKGMGKWPAGLFDRLLAAVRPRPAAVHVVTACLESLDALERNSDGLTDEEQAEIEEGVLEAARLTRRFFTTLARNSRAAPAYDVYPRPGDLEPARWHAGYLFSGLQGLTEKQRLAVVRVDPDYQIWPLVELTCAESVVQASRNLERAAAWARLAQEIADRVRGPEGWCLRVRGYVAAHLANVLRVTGKVKAARAAFEIAKRLWLAGSDRGNVLDPGRLLDLEASLCRDERQFEKALALLDEARLVGGRCPARYLINKGFTLEVMGEYERAVETLREAEREVERQGDPRMSYMWRFNLAVNYCHAGRYREAMELAQQVRELATERRDENEVIRVTWLAGRIAAGLGRSAEARSLLAQARREFEGRKMWYDVVLALLEEAALLLDEERFAEVKALTPALAKVFASNGIHREALAALRLFQEAAERGRATAELARRTLRFLFRARHDQGLRFES